MQIWNPSPLRRRIYFAVIIIMVCSVMLGGCSLAGNAYQSTEGYQQTEKARDLYEELDSGRLTIVDNSSGEISQDFIFRYEGDRLTYSYMVADESEIYYEYHNGSEINYTTDEEGRWNALDIASEGYFVKTKSDRHPLAARTAISINPDSIISGTVAQQADGGLVITYAYDIEKLAGYATALESVGTLTDFTTVLEINAEGYCTALTQRGSFIGADGEELAVDYTMTITEMNSVEQIVRPTPLWEYEAD